MSSAWARSRGFKEALRTCEYLPSHHLAIVVERVALSLGDDTSAKSTSSSSTAPFSEADFDALCRKVLGSMRKRQRAVDARRGDADADIDDEDDEHASHRARVLRGCDKDEEKEKEAASDAEAANGVRPRPPETICEYVQSMLAALVLALQSAAFYGLKADRLYAVLLGTEHDDADGTAACGERVAGVVAEAWREHGSEAVARIAESGGGGWIADRLVRTEWKVALNVASSGDAAARGSNGGGDSSGSMQAQTIMELLIRPAPGSVGRPEKRVTLSMNEAETEKLFHQLEDIQMEIDKLE